MDKGECMVYFVATPIGNLAEITFRAIEVLKNVDIIFCEDTRHSIKLLNHYSIKKPLYACHKFNEKQAAEKILVAAQEGKNIAILSDAGMPSICDPGYCIVEELQKNAIEYTVLSGACAFVNALVLSGFSTMQFTFLGFLRGNTKEKKALLQQHAKSVATIILYVAPHDVDKDIALLYEVFGERDACAVREISKIHESVEHFTLATGLKGEKRGEYVLLIKGAKSVENLLNHLPEREHIAHYMQLGMDKKTALKQVAADRGVPKNTLYKFTIDSKD